MTHLQQHNEKFRTEIEAEYKNFLSYIDSKSEQYAGTDEHERLQQVYAFVSGRIDMLHGILSAEAEDNAALRKELNRIETEGDQAEWDELAAELFEDADYKEDTAAFKAFVDEEGVQLRNDIKALIADWRACVEEGKITDLAMLLEAIAEEEEEGEGELDFSLDGETDFAPREQQGACATDASDSDDESCSTEAFERDGCCGSKDPCCKSDNN